MTSTNYKLRLAGALAVLATLALAVSCQGFFPKATLTSIALQPPTPTFGVGFQQPMQAWGTDSNNHRYQLTSNVVWTLSAPSSGTVATIDAGSGTMIGKNAGTITVQASAQGLSGTTTATVVETVSSMTINPTSTSVVDDGNQVAQFTVCGPGGCGSQDLTSLVTLTASQNGVAEGSNLPCSYNAATLFQECQPVSGLVPTGTSQDFLIVVTYGGYTGTAQVSAKLTVTGP
jgi:Bacterial Ig-like domain (group 2)